MTTHSYASIEVLLRELKDGRPVLLGDDSDRENEFDLVYPAQTFGVPEFNFLLNHARGVICLAFSYERAANLGLRLMCPSQDFSGYLGTPFAMTIEAAEGVSTGASVHDRVRTIQVAADPSSTPSSIIHPGHISPLIARPGGVFNRQGHTEASTDLIQLAGFTGVVVLCELLLEDGHMARQNGAEQFSKEQGIKIGLIKDLLHYMACVDTHVDCIRKNIINTSSGSFCRHLFRIKGTDQFHLAFVRDRELDENAERNVFLLNLRNCCGPLGILASPSSEISSYSAYFPQLSSEIDVLLMTLPTSLEVQKFLLDDEVSSSSSYVASAIAYQMLSYLGIRHLSLYGDLSSYSDLLSYPFSSVRCSPLGNSCAPVESQLYCSP